MELDISFDLCKRLNRTDIVGDAEPNAGLTLYFLIEKEFYVVNPFALRAAADYVE